MTSISFERKNGKIYDKLTGKELDQAILSTFPVDYEPDHMSGRVDLPTSFLVPEKDGGLKFLGTTVASATVIEDADFKVEGIRDPKLSEIIPGRFTLEVEPGEKTDFASEELKDLGADKEEVFTDRQYPLSDEETIPPKSKYVDDIKILNVLFELGLAPRPNRNGSIHRWYHPSFGEDRPDNWLLFDHHDDPIESLLPKIFRQGAALGTRVLKLQIKAAIEQH